jgi:DNA-binding CsgD family transcriptional regulator
MSAMGKTNKQIGNSLSLSVHTVKYHKANIYRKYGGNSIVDILINGIRRGVIDPNELE